MAENINLENMTDQQLLDLEKQLINDSARYNSMQLAQKILLDIRD